MTSFTHVLMTRFNLATPGREEVIRNRPDWLTDRFDLFERYCLPSVAAQSEMSFQWIIYFDKDTPPEFKARIDMLRAKVDFHPYYTGFFDGSGWSRSLGETCELEHPMLLTTRLDNDDALSRDFIVRLQAAVKERNHATGVYNFPNGLIRRGNALYVMEHRSNPFFSLLEPVSDAFVTASSVHHMHLSDHGSVHQIPAPPVWMQVVHGSNVSNKVRGRRVDPTDAAARFAGEAGVGCAPVGRLTLIVETALLAPLRDARDRLLAMVRGHGSSG